MLKTCWEYLNIIIFIFTFFLFHAISSIFFYLFIYSNISSVLQIHIISYTAQAYHSFFSSISLISWQYSIAAWLSIVIAQFYSVSWESCNLSYSISYYLWVCVVVVVVLWRPAAPLCNPNGRYQTSTHRRSRFRYQLLIVCPRCALLPLPPCPNSSTSYQHSTWVNVFSFIHLFIACIHK